MTYAAPNVTGMPINSGSSSAYIPYSGRQTGVTGIGGLFRNAKGSSFIEVGANNDAQRITYYSPRFAGFQVGASYARDGNQDSSFAGDNINGSPLSNIFDVGANYVNSFGGVDVAVSGRYGIADNDVTGAEDPEVFAFGTNVGFGGFTVGYAFSESNDSGNLDSQGHSAGASYETGPWGVSVTYYRGEGVDAENPFAVNANGNSANDETYQAIMIGGSYALASGVSLSLYGMYGEADEETSDSGAPGGDDIEGFLIGSAISLSF
jgi:predicted porin